MLCTTTKKKKRKKREKERRRRRNERLDGNTSLESRCYQNSPYRLEKKNRVPIRALDGICIVPVQTPTKHDFPRDEGQNVNKRLY